MKLLITRLIDFSFNYDTNIVKYFISFLNNQELGLFYNYRDVKKMRLVDLKSRALMNTYKSKMIYGLIDNTLIIIDDEVFIELFQLFLESNEYLEWVKKNKPSLVKKLWKWKHHYIKNTNESL